MFADWRQNQPEGNEESATGGGFELFGDFSTHPARIRTRDVSTDSKSRICRRFCVGLMGNGCGLFKASFGAWALKSLTYVAHERDAFNLDIEIKAK